MWSKYPPSSFFRIKLCSPGAAVHHSRWGRKCPGDNLSQDPYRWNSHQRGPGRSTTWDLIQSCMLCSQHTNVAEAIRNGVGLLEDWHSLEADSLLASVQEVLSNPKYKEAVTRLSDLIMDTPQHPLDRSTWTYSPFTFCASGRCGGWSTCFDTRITPG